MHILIHQRGGKAGAEWLREVAQGLGMYLDHDEAPGTEDQAECWMTDEPMAPSDDNQDISADAFDCFCDGLDPAQAVKKLRDLAQSGEAER